MHERIHIIRHKEKQILFVDCSTCSAAEVEKIARLVPELSQPSRLLLFVCSSISRERSLTKRPSVP